MGTINLHASLLPQYRGAAPIHHAIINGEKQTGLTTFLLQKEIDTGNILLQKKLEIGPEETVGELHDRMMVEGAKLLVETIEKLRDGKVTPIDQKKLITPGTILKSAPKIYKNDCRIQWNNDLDSVHNFIRGLSPFPCAFSELKSPKGEIFHVKIYRASREKSSKHLSPGAIPIEKGWKRKKYCVGFTLTKTGILPVKTEIIIDSYRFLPDFINKIQDLSTIFNFF